MPEIFAQADPLELRVVGVLEDSRVGQAMNDLFRDLLYTNRKAFVHKNPDGSEDKTGYTTAAAMIAMLNIGATGFNDGLYYDSSAADIGHLKAVFEKIFTVMGQEQHFNMMMGRV